MVFSSCHKERNLIINDDFDTVGNWILSAGALTSAEITNGQIDLFAGQNSYGTKASALLNFDDDNSNKICFEIEFGTFSMPQVNEYVAGLPKNITIQVGNLKLIQKSYQNLNLPEFNTNTPIVDLSDKVVQIEINTKSKTFKVKVPHGNLNFSKYFELQEVSSQENFILFEAADRVSPSTSISTETQFNINSLKVYRLR